MQFMPNAKACPLELQVDVLFMTIHSEAGDCLKAADLQTLKVGRKAMRVAAQANSVFQIRWGTALKLPDSVRDPKVLLSHNLESIVIMIAIDDSVQHWLCIDSCTY